jgi:hypothetical protein
MLKTLCGAKAGWWLIPPRGSTPSAVVEDKTRIIPYELLEALWRLLY